MAKTFTITDFYRRFPTDETCLDHLLRLRYGEMLNCPRCEREAKFYKLKKEPAYSCEWCGHHIHPMVGTPFERSRTPLQKWFYAMYLFTTSRHGVPAKELQRQLGITYKAAWRMAHEIRKYMAKVDGDEPLDGHTEADETMIGGKRKGAKRGRGAPGKTTVFGMLQRDGDVVTRVVANVRRVTLEAHILEHISKGATISTNELKSYAKLARHGYKHGAVNHSAEQWVDADPQTNSLEGFWSRIKNSIRGTHIYV